MTANIYLSSLISNDLISISNGILGIIYYGMSIWLHNNEISKKIKLKFSSGYKKHLLSLAFFVIAFSISFGVTKFISADPSNEATSINTPNVVDTIAIINQFCKENVIVRIDDFTFDERIILQLIIDGRSPKAIEATHGIPPFAQKELLLRLILRLKESGMFRNQEYKREK